MRIHHFYPRTGNIGDHFVQRGIATLISGVVDNVEVKLFDVNSRGVEREYGLTETAIERANREAELVIIGGSNLYEGAWNWPWGVHLDSAALPKLRVPLFLLGIGTGSAFASKRHHPSRRALSEIKLLNEGAALSAVRDVTTLEWLRNLGITKARLLGDPANFIFNHPLRSANEDKHILIVMPPRRVWSSKRQFRSVRTIGRPIFHALASLKHDLMKQGYRVVVACNDRADLPVAHELFGPSSEAVVCPDSVDEYFKLLSNSSAVISGRLHTAVVAFSLGIPFVLVNIDQRTSGFIKTYGLEDFSVDPSPKDFAVNLNHKVSSLLSQNSQLWWQIKIAARDEMHHIATTALREAIKSMDNHFSAF